MEHRNTSTECASSPTWEGLHGWLRGQIQRMIQQLLEEELSELLGRVRYQRRATIDGPAGSRLG